MTRREHRHGADAAKLGEIEAAGVLSPLAHRYYAIAVRHQQAAAAAPPGKDSDDSAIAIFFAIAALEAYLPEIDALGKSVAFQRPLDVAAVRGARKVTERDEDNQIELAYANVDPEAAKDEDWYGALRCLRLLRNALVHYKAKWEPPFAWPKRLKPDDCRRLIAGWRTAPAAWSGQVLTPEVAAWACVTVRATIEWFHGCVGGVSPWADEPGSIQLWDSLPA